MRSSPWISVGPRLQPRWDRLQQSERHLYSITTRTLYTYKKPCTIFYHKSVSIHNLFLKSINKWKISYFEERPKVLHHKSYVSLIENNELNELIGKKDMLNKRKGLDPSYLFSIFQFSLPKFIVYKLPVWRFKSAFFCH